MKASADKLNKLYDEYQNSIDNIEADIDASWELAIKSDGVRAGIDCRGIVGMAVVHAMVDKISDLNNTIAELRNRISNIKRI